MQNVDSDYSVSLDRSPASTLQRKRREINDLKRVHVSRSKPATSRVLHLSVPRPAASSFHCIDALAHRTMSSAAFAAPTPTESLIARNAGASSLRCAPRVRARPVRRRAKRVSMGADSLVRTLSANGEVSARVVTGTSLVGYSAALHGTSAVATTAFGRTLLCALLLAAGRKGGDTTQIQFRGSGPLQGVTAIATGAAQVRGYVGDPRARVPPTAAGGLDVPAAIGPGVLAVVRNSLYAKAPYTGLVQISSGEVAQDVAHYLLESEQVPSAMSAGVRLGLAGDVQAAGGFLVQLLPGASEESVRILERNVQTLPPVTELLVQGYTPEDIVARLMQDLQPMQVMQTEPKYVCGCGLDRLKRTISLLPVDEVEQLLVEQKKIEATCEFCGKKYALSTEQVQSVLNSK